MQPSTFNPCIDRKRQLILVAPVFKDLSIGINRRDIESFFNIIPVDDLISFSRNDYRAFLSSISTDWCNIRLHCIFLEGSDLLYIAFFQILFYDVLNRGNGGWTPVVGLRGIQIRPPAARLAPAPAEHRRCWKDVRTHTDDRRRRS